MGGLRSTTYEIKGTTSDAVVSAIEKVLSPLYFRTRGSADKDMWVSMGFTDGYWYGFVRRDSNGMSLSLVYHIEDSDDESVELHLVWDRYGILSKLYPFRDALAMVAKWQSALEDGFRNAGFQVQKTFEY